MNNWTWSPLQYAASLVVFGVIVAYAAACTFSSRVREHSWLLIGGPLQVIYWSIGKLSWWLIRAGQVVFWLIYAQAELWGLRSVANMFHRWVRGLDHYWRLRQYRPEHAARA